MPEEAIEVRKTISRKEVMRLNDLIVRLEEKLSLMTPNDLKRVIKSKLQEVDQNTETLMKSINEIHRLLE
jgi:predicted DNA-binding protein YlxM (UPF0122 family)